MDDEAMQKRVGVAEVKMENVIQLVGDMKEYIEENVADRLDFFEVMDEALSVGVIKHKHYENGEVYIGEPKECKKYCK